MYDKCKRMVVFLAIVILAAANLMGCSAPKASLKYTAVSGDNLVVECTDPVEVHNVPPIRFPIPAQVSRHHNCMGVGDLLAIAWPLDSTEVNIAAVNLLGLMYVEYENRGKTDTKLTISHIKNGSYSDGDTHVNVAFFELLEVSLEKSK
jgi:hypothetical protein